MTRKWSVGIGSLLVAGLVSVVAFRSASTQTVEEDPPGVTTIHLDWQEPSPDEPRTTIAEATARKLANQTIEEQLAESEDDGACYYMSRIREAVEEGNPAFGQVLLAQMREQHATSALIGHAEELFGEEE